MPTQWEIEAPLRWMELHLFCLRADADPVHFTPSAIGAWMTGFRNRIICPACQKKWDESFMVKLWPNTDLFAWSVTAHNDVSGSIGKKTMSQEDARTHWEGVAKEIAQGRPVRKMALVAITPSIATATKSTCGDCGKK